MKPLLLTCAFITAIATAANSQGFSVGPRIGINFSSVKASGGSQSQEDALNNYFKGYHGLQAGAAVNFGLSQRLSLQTEVVLSQLGYKNVSNGISVSYRQSYIQVPLLGRFRANPAEGKVNFYVLAGPYAGYWLSGKLKAEIDGREQKMDYIFDDNDADDGLKDNRLDFGLTGGFGLGLKTGPGTLLLDVRYMYGLSDVIAYKEGRPSEMPLMGVRNTGIAATYFFAFGE